MKLQTFLDYYKPLDSKEKIDKLFALCFSSKHLSICANAFSKILDVMSEDISPYFFEKKTEYDNHIKQLQEKKKKRKKKVPKGSKPSSSVFNKDEVVYKRIHIISTAM